MKKILIANWKMYKTRREALSFLAALYETRALDVRIAAPYTLLFDLAEAARGSPILIGAQNVNPYSEGPYTGEISLTMLKDAGAQFVLVGHSERRILFHEDDRAIQAKVERCVVEGFPVVLCIGESKEEGEGGETDEVLKRQLENALDSLSLEHMEKVLIAYEPLSAIGTGKAASAFEINKIHREIKDFLLERFGATLPILYGGSVTPENVVEFMRQENIAGTLIGGASLDPEIMNEMIRKLEQLRVV